MIDRIISNKKENFKNRKVSAGSTFELEKILTESGYDIIIGTDEVGRGPLCGPVVACAVALKNPQCHPEFISGSREYQEQNEMLKQVQHDKMWDLVRDSKKLSEKQREKVFDFINEHFHVGIGLCDHETIDRINILEASFLAMKKAIQELKRNIEKEKATLCHSREIGNPESNSNLDPHFRGDDKIGEKIIILVDGNKTIPNLSMEQQAVIGGDRIVKSISAASIVAKVTRDRMMKEFALKYPQYGLEKHMGYGTKIHMEALAKYGPCPIHRQSFAPVKKLLYG